MSTIRRMVTVIEYVDAAGTHAALIVQDHGTADIMLEDEFTWQFDDCGHLIKVWHPPGPRRIDMRTGGVGSITFFENADDLFAQWQGPQPGRGTAAELADRPAIEPPRKELEP